MLPPIPYLDFAGYKRLSPIVPEDLDGVDARYPGYIEHRLAVGSSVLNARLAKRYLVPLGQEAPELLAFGTTPPAVALSGRPTLGCLEVALEVTTPGSLGTAVFQWSQDGGESWTTGVATAATVPLGQTGLTATMPAGAVFAADNVYKAGTPVPAIALGWLVALVDVEVWARRGADPQDPEVLEAKAARELADAQVLEAANSEAGLFELPTNDPAGDSAVTKGGPLFYSEQSPYVWQQGQRRGGRANDRAGCGDFGGTDS